MAWNIQPAVVKRNMRARGQRKLGYILALWEPLGVADGPAQQEDILFAPPPSEHMQRGNLALH